MNHGHRRVAAHQSPNHAGFTLLEIMFVLLIIGMLAAIVYPSYRHARQHTTRNACLNNMRKIEDAKAQWAMAAGKRDGAPVAWTNLLPYLKIRPECPTLGTYQLESVGVGCYCTFHDWRGGAPEYAGFKP